MTHTKRNKGSWLVGLVVITIAMAGCGSEGDSGSASVGSRGGTGITNTVSSPAEMSVGDIMAVELDDADAVIDFVGVDGDADFILVLGNTDTDSSGSMLISGSLSDDLDESMIVDLNKAPLAEEDDIYGPSEILSAWLRASESELADTMPRPVTNLSKGATSADTSYSEGDVETFSVLNSLTSVSSYATVTAKARCVGEYVSLFVDTSVGSDKLDNADVAELCEIYDDVTEREFEILGEPSDVNEDGHVTVLMTPQINRLGAMAGGIVTGYFYARDLSSVSNSNVQEIVYTLVPDPDGDYGVAVSKNFAMNNLLPAVYPHELQHAISYNQHVYMNGGSSEAPWLNEGMSHLMEDVMGYNRENPSRYSIFLANPSNTSLASSGSPNLQERGAAYLFMRFLYEQSSNGNAFLRRLENTSDTGVENVENAFASNDESFDQFSEFMARWSIALAITDRGVSQDTRYVYEARTQDPDTDNWNGVVIQGYADDGRGTNLNGVNLTSYSGHNTASIQSSAAKYYEVDSVPDSIAIEASNGGYAVLIRTN